MTTSGTNTMNLINAGYNYFLGPEQGQPLLIRRTDTPEWPNFGQSFERVETFMPHATRASAQATRASAQATRAPAHATGAPAKATGAPAKAAGVRAQATRAPAQATGAPAKATGAPAKATGAPAKATRAPANARRRLMKCFTRVSTKTPAA